MTSNRSAVRSATVPLLVEGDRPFVDLDLIGPSGAAERARFWADTGGGALILTEALARKLGIEVTPAEDGGRFARIPAPRATVGDIVLNLEGAEVLVALGTETVSGSSALGLLGAPVLSRYRVVFDYPGRTFTLAVDGRPEARGAALPTPVHPESGFPRAEVEVAGERFGMLLDTGASYTMLSRDLLDRWAGEHPDWPRSVGATGTAVMGTRHDADALVMTVPALAWGPCELEGVGVVSRPAGTFEESVSKWTTEPVVGALAGNALTRFRLEIDYAAGVTYVERAPVPGEAAAGGDA